MGDIKKFPENSNNTEINAFLQKVAATPLVKSTGKRGRLIFAMDATASRGPTWDRACQIQAQMFKETAALGGLEIQLCYYRGYGEFHATQWLSQSEDLLKKMSAVTFLGGYTQIEKILRHAGGETQQKKVNALVFIGDCVEEDPDTLCQLAGELGLHNVPVFLFQEGNDPIAARTFKQIAHLTNGAYCPFDSSSAHQLRDLLSAVAVYAAGGRHALENYGKLTGNTVLQLIHQIKKG